MIKEFEFDRRKVLKSLLFFTILLLLSVWFVFEPKRFIMNVFMKEYHVLIIGYSCGLVSALKFISILLIINRKIAIVVTGEYLIDNSSYESLGKIYWSAVKRIQVKPSGNLKIVVEKNELKLEKKTLFQKLLLHIQNLDYKNSVVISSTLLKCSFEELEESILTAFKNNR
jgi:hypothetical protein